LTKLEGLHTTRKVIIHYTYNPNGKECFFKFTLKVFYLVAGGFISWTINYIQTRPLTHLKKKRQIIQTLAG
jgi:hypothetical protein